LPVTDAAVLPRPCLRAPRCLRGALQVDLTSEARALLPGRQRSRVDRVL